MFRRAIYIYDFEVERKRSQILKSLKYMYSRSESNEAQKISDCPRPLISMRDLFVLR